MTHSEAALTSSRMSPVSQVVHGALIRVVLSILVPAIWISLTLVYVAFFAPSFTFFQDLVLVLVSILGLGAALLAMWVSFGLRIYHRWVDW